MRYLILGTIFFCACVAPARAQATAATAQAPASPASPAAAAARDDDGAGPFDKGTWNFSLTGSYIHPIRFSQAELYNFQVAAGYYLIDNTSLNLELQGYWANEPDGQDDALIGALFVLGRTHLFRWDKWSIFIDGGGGVSYADHKFPQYPYDGTNFNFMAKVGLGATYELSEHSFLIGGARYYHLSNGQIRGRDDNPSYDGIQFWGGMMWTW